MGYFSNGCEGYDYEEQYCRRCVHYGPEEGPGCAIWLAHLIHNYDECDNDNSILHVLIPVNADGHNEECRLFIDAGRYMDVPVPDPTTPASVPRDAAADLNYVRLWLRQANAPKNIVGLQERAMTLLEQEEI